MTDIEWTHRPGTKGESWNPVVGCSIATPGCTHCYAMQMAARIERMGTAPHYAGLTKTVNGNAVWTGDVRMAPDHIINAPLRGTKPRTYFVNSMGDLFHESVPDAWIDRVFAVMALSPRHTFIVLTKRADRMRAYVNAVPQRAERCAASLVIKWDEPERVLGVLRSDYVGARPWPLHNVWLGVSAERQQEADVGIPDLLATPAAVRLVSAEPLLGPINFEAIPRKSADGFCRPLDGRFNRIDWIIVGGESGPNARPMHPDWARSIRDQCAASGVAFFFKQWGEWEVAMDRDKHDPDWKADYTNFYAENDKSRWLNLAGGRGFHGERFHVMRRVGKQRSGSKLDGREHKEWPHAQA